jgi:hypothetical protein
MAAVGTSNMVAVTIVEVAEPPDDKSLAGSCTRLQLKPASTSTTLRFN